MGGRKYRPCVEYYYVSYIHKSDSRIGYTWSHLQNGSRKETALVWDRTRPFIFIVSTCTRSPTRSYGNHLGPGMFQDFIRTFPSYSRRARVNKLDAYNFVHSCEQIRALSLRTILYTSSRKSMRNCAGICAHGVDAVVICSQ